MEKLVLNIKDSGKLGFFLELIKQFDFVEVQTVKEGVKPAKKHDFFASAGIWSEKEIDATALRKKAWKKER